MQSGIAQHLNVHPPLAPTALQVCVRRGCRALCVLLLLRRLAEPHCHPNHAGGATRGDTPNASYAPAQHALCGMFVDLTHSSLCGSPLHQLLIQRVTCASCHRASLCRSSWRWRGWASWPSAGAPLGCSGRRTERQRWQSSGTARGMVRSVVLRGTVVLFPAPATSTPTVWRPPAALVQDAEAHLGGSRGETVAVPAGWGGCLGCRGGPGRPLRARQVSQLLLEPMACACRASGRDPGGQKAPECTWECYCRARTAQLDASRHPTPPFPPSPTHPPTHPCADARRWQLRCGPRRRPGYAASRG